MFAVIRKLCLGLGVSLGVALAGAPAATAGISEFNEAMRRGDVKAASAESVEIWETWDKSDPDTALMAREFGFVAMMAGDYPVARQFGRFLWDEGPGLAKPDDYPLTSAVLLRAAEHRLRDNEETRALLHEALEARRAEEGVDLISATGAEILYNSDWQKGDWKALEESAPLAVDLLGRGQQGLLPRQRRAELVVAAGNFLNQRNYINDSRNSTYDVMADVHDKIAADIDAEGNAAIRERLWPVKWEAEAWAQAIASYLTSDYSGIDTLIKRKLEPRPLEQPNIGFIAEDPEVAPFPTCAGSWEGPRIRYPQNRAFAGIVGAVIVRLETDDQGQVIDTELLASIPLQSFSDAVLKAVKDWRFEPDKDADLRNCRLQSRARVLRVTFYIA